MIRNNFKVGDKIARICPPDKVWSASVFHGVVTKIDSETGNVTVKTLTDVWSTMVFDKHGMSKTDNDHFIVRLEWLEWMFKPDTYFFEIIGGEQ